MLRLETGSVLDLHELVTDRQDQKTLFLRIGEHTLLHRETGENPHHRQGPSSGKKLRKAVMSATKWSTSILRRVALVLLR